MTPQACLRAQQRRRAGLAARPHAGFGGATPWLPLHRDRGRRHVAAQRADPGSLWRGYSALIALQRDDPALQGGAHWPLRSGHPQVLVFGRRADDGSLAVVLLNWGGQDCEVAVQGLPAGCGAGAEVLLAHPPLTTPPSWGRVPLAPWGVTVLRAPRTG